MAKKSEKISKLINKQKKANSKPKRGQQSRKNLGDIEQKVQNSKSLSRKRVALKKDYDATQDL